MIELCNLFVNFLKAARWTGKNICLVLESLEYNIMLKLNIDAPSNYKGSMYEHLCYQHNTRTII